MKLRALWGGRAPLHPASLALAAMLTCGGTSMGQTGRLSNDLPAAPAATAPALPTAASQPRPGLPSVFANPATNLYMNPYLGNTQIPPDVALYYMLQSHNAAGGIGSGAISGVRDLEQGRRPQNTSSRASAASPRGTTPPSEGTDRYFHRGPNRFGSRSGKFFQRYGGRFDQ